MQNDDRDFDVVAYTNCVNFAAIKHRHQRRKDPDKTPYINHPIGMNFIALITMIATMKRKFAFFLFAGVANILTSEADVKDLNVLMAAILHDTVEDTDTTFSEIEEHFGPIIRGIVEEVTDDKTLSKQERKRLQIEHAKDSTYEAKLVKLADKLYNLRDLEKFAPEGWTDVRRQPFAWRKKKIEFS